MLYQNGKILYFNKNPYLKYLQCLLIVLKYDQKFNFVQEIKLQYIQKKKWQASTTTHDLFVNNLKISPTFICRGEVPSNTFAKLPVYVLINDPKKLDPKSSLQSQTHHLVMWPTSTSTSKCFRTFSKLPLSVLINDPQIKGQASTRAHDPFSDNLKIWSTFIYRGEVPSNTFAKLPVCVLINDLKKLDPKSSLQLKTHHLVMWPTSTSRPKHFHTFLKLPLSTLINDPQKKRDGHQLGPMTHFQTTSKFDLLSYTGEKCLQTHLQSFLCMS